MHIKTNPSAGPRDECVCNGEFLAREEIHVLSLRIGSIVFTPEGLLLAGALCVFLFASYPRLRRDVGMKRRATLALLAWVSFCGVAGAALYGIPGTLDVLNRPEPLAVHRAVSFGSFGGYWGVLLGAAAAAPVARRRMLPLLDAFVPGILLGGLVARAFFVVGASHFTSFLSVWSMCDMAVHLGLFVGMLAAESRLGGRCLTPGFRLAVLLVGYGVIRFGLEFFRTDSVLWGPFTWGHHMSVVQSIIGVAIICTSIRPGKHCGGSTASNSSA